MGKIVQLTDIHVCINERCHGIDTKDHFLKALEKAKSINPNCLMISGDLACDDGGIEIYQWIKEKLDQSKLAYWIMPGNHDQPTQMKTVFSYPKNSAAEFIDFTFNLDSHLIICLDTTSGFVAQSQLNWIDHSLRAADLPTIIFMHHPPILTGHKFMDGCHKLQNTDEVWRVLVPHAAKIKHVFSGHYHDHSTQKKDGIYVTVTPSTMAQLDRDSPTVKPIPEKFGFGVIHLETNLSEVDYQVVWL